MISFNDKFFVSGVFEDIFKNINTTFKDIKDGAGNFIDGSKAVLDNVQDTLNSVEFNVKTTHSVKSTNGGMLFDFPKLLLVMPALTIFLRRY